MNKDFLCTQGTDVKHFSHFDYVFSGHFHKQSTSGNVSYLGNTYQIYWNDEGEERGFHIFDLETQNLEFIKNPNKMFHKIYYDETKKKLFNPNKYRTHTSRLLLKVNPHLYVCLVSLILYMMLVYDIKVIENYEIEVEEGKTIEVGRILFSPN